VPLAKLLILIGVFFVTSLVSVATGSTSLITVPVMIALGIETHVAIATNMLALTLMSAGGSLAFIGKQTIHRKRLPLLLVLTVVGSTIGAIVMLRVPVRAMQLTVAAAMIAATISWLIKPDFGLARVETAPSRTVTFAGYAITFLLAIYGGFFSGGYVTILTAAFVFFFGMTFLESIATTKVVNFFSSGVATLVFLWRGVVNLKLGLLLGVTMFVGALLGSRISMKLSAAMLRWIFVGVVLVLALRMLWLASAR
jgi:uncharacterized membrane protein YfcA